MPDWSKFKRPKKPSGDHPAIDDEVFEISQEHSNSSKRLNSKECKAIVGSSSNENHHNTISISSQSNRDSDSITSEVYTSSVGNSSADLTRLEQFWTSTFPLVYDLIWLSITELIHVGMAISTSCFQEPSNEDEWTDKYTNEDDDISEDRLRDNFRDNNYSNHQYRNLVYLPRSPYRLKTKIAPISDILRPQPKGTRIQYYPSSQQSVPLDHRFVPDYGMYKSVSVVSSSASTPGKQTFQKSTNITPATQSRASLCDGRSNQSENRDLRKIKSSSTGSIWTCQIGNNPVTHNIRTQIPLLKLPKRNFATISAPPISPATTSSLTPSPRSPVAQRKAVTERRHPPRRGVQLE